MEPESMGIDAAWNQNQPPLIDGTTVALLSASGGGPVLSAVPPACHHPRARSHTHGHTDGRERLLCGPRAPAMASRGLPWPCEASRTCNNWITRIAAGARIWTLRADPCARAGPCVPCTCAHVPCGPNPTPPPKPCIRAASAAFAGATDWGWRGEGAEGKSREREREREKERE